MRKRRIILIAILALLLISALWYMRPRTLDTVIGLQGKTVTSIAMSGIFLEDSWDANGVYWPVHRSFEIDHDSADSDEILELLRSTRYSRSLRSLLSPDSVSLGGTGGTVSISMVLDNEEFVTMTVGSIVTFGLPDHEGFTLARADDGLFILLEEYLRENGVES